MLLALLTQQGSAVVAGSVGWEITVLIGCSSLAVAAAEVRLLPVPVSEVRVLPKAGCRPTPVAAAAKQVVAGAPLLLRVSLLPALCLEVSKVGEAVPS